LAQYRSPTKPFLTYSAAKFYTFSREFTLFHEIFFFTGMTANNAKNSLSWAFSQKIFRTQNNPWYLLLLGKIKDFL
jgi:hypothetical protein